MAKYTDREGPIHRAIYGYLCAMFPAPQVVVHVKNEIKKPGKAKGWVKNDIAMEIAKAKKMGLVPGFPDLMVVRWAPNPPLLFEVKAEGGTLSEAQRSVHERLSALGYRVAVVRSIDDVREALTEWSIPTRHIEGVK